MSTTTSPQSNNNGAATENHSANAVPAVQQRRTSIFARNIPTTKPTTTTAVAVSSIAPATGTQAVSVSLTPAQVRPLTTTATQVAPRMRFFAAPKANQPIQTTPLSGTPTTITTQPVVLPGDNLVEQLRTQIQEAQKKQTSTETENQNLKKDIALKDKTIAELQQSATDNKRQVTTLTEQLEAVEKHKNELTGKIDKLTAAATDSAELANVRKQLNEVSEKHAVLTQERNQQAKQVERQSEVLTALQQEKLALEQGENALRLEGENLKQRIVDLEGKLESSEKAFKEEQQNLEKAVADFKTKLEEAGKKNAEESDILLADKDKTIAELQQNVANTKEQVATLTGQLETVEKDKNALTAQVTTLAADSAELANVREQLDEVSKKHAVLTQERNQLAKQVERQSKALTALQQEKLTLEKEKAEENEKLSIECGKLKKIAKGLVSRWQQSENETTTEDVEDRTRLEESEKVPKEEIATLKATVSDLQAKLQEAEDKNAVSSNLTAKVARLEHSEKDLKEIVQDLEAKLKEGEQRFADDVTNHVKALNDLGITFANQKELEEAVKTKRQTIDSLNNIAACFEIVRRYLDIQATDTLTPDLVAAKAKEKFGQLDVAKRPPQKLDPQKKIQQDLAQSAQAQWALKKEKAARAQLTSTALDNSSSNTPNTKGEKSFERAPLQKTGSMPELSKPVTESQGELVASTTSGIANTSNLFGKKRSGSVISSAVVSDKDKKARRQSLPAALPSNKGKLVADLANIFEGLKSKKS